MVLGRARQPHEKTRGQCSSHPRLPAGSETPQRAQGHLAVVPVCHIPPPPPWGQSLIAGNWITRVLYFPSSELWDATRPRREQGPAPRAREVGTDSRGPERRAAPTGVQAATSPLPTASGDDSQPEAPGVGVSRCMGCPGAGTSSACCKPARRARGCIDGAHCPSRPRALGFRGPALGGHVGLRLLGLGEPPPPASVPTAALRDSLPLPPPPGLTTHIERVDPGFVEESEPVAELQRRGDSVVAGLQLQVSRSGAEGKEPPAAQAAPQSG